MYCSSVYDTTAIKKQGSQRKKRCMGRTMDIARVPIQTNNAFQLKAALRRSVAYCSTPMRGSTQCSTSTIAPIGIRMRP